MVKGVRLTLPELRAIKRAARGVSVAVWMRARLLTGLEVLGEVVTDPRQLGLPLPLPEQSLSHAPAGASTRPRKAARSSKPGASPVRSKAPKKKAGD